MSNEKLQPVTYNILDTDDNDSTNFETAISE